MQPTNSLEAWLIIGSQHLYGDEALRQVADHGRQVAESLNGSGRLPFPVVCKPVVTTPESILAVCREANSNTSCLGLICWMHTFSPAKMWIADLECLQKPLAHLHTQFNRDIPWSTIDMDFMNLNQSAHGCRQFGFIGSRRGSPARSWSGNGRMSRSSANWACGRGPRLRGRTGRVRGSPALATTCATWR